MQNIFLIAKNNNMYFNYHAKIKKLILQNHLTNILFFDKYNKISPAIVFIFNNNKPMPIRQYKWQDYVCFLKENSSKYYRLFCKLIDNINSKSNNK